MPNFIIADREARDLLEEIMAETFPYLGEAGVTVGLLFALPKGDADGPALKHHGYAALAIVKVNSLRCRVEGKPDCTIALDGEQWPDMPDARRRALLDHELTHLEIVRGKDGKPKTDDAGRPKLRLRLHDFELGGFWETCQRHQKDAVEAGAFIDLQKQFTQKLLPWG